MAERRQGRGLISRVILSVFFLVFLMAGGSPGVFAEDTTLAKNGGRGPTDEYERLLFKGLESIRNNQLDEAIEDFRQLTMAKPDFRLAQLIYGDLLMARANPLPHFGNAPAQSKEDVESLLDEARIRLRYLAQTPPGANLVPEPIVQLAPWQEHAIVVDLEKSRLYLFRNSQETPSLLADYYITSGKFGADKSRKGDKKTPIGLYHITDHLLGQKLPNFYGVGALPINYPNEWDKLHKRTGRGIWLHGTPVDTYSRPPRASDGCVVLINSDLGVLQAMVAIGTPVIITESLSWLTHQEWQKHRQEILSQLNQWKEDWNSRKINRVLRHYGEDFHNSRHDLASWTKELAYMMKDHPLQDLSIDSLSVIGYPTTDGTSMFVVTFPAERSKDPLTRRQYWQRMENGTWQITFEELLLG